MNRMFVASLSSAGTLLVFGLLGQYVPRWIGLDAPWFWVLRGLLWTIGLVATLLLFLYQRARAKALPKSARDDEVDGAFDAVRKRLPAGVKLGRAPVLLVIGPGGAAKTTVVQRSGLDPELLAGEVERNQSVVPTTINVWYSDGTIVTEVGGRLIEDEKRWGRLLGRIEPSRLAAMLPGGRQAPRLAIVCLSCEELVKPGAAQSAASQGQALRQRLVEAANQFGIRLPVYVVFTKADRLPYFADYVRSLTAQEAGEVLGTTLPVSPPMDAGRFKEAENARLDTAFSRFLHTLSLRRLDVLPRETTEEVRAGAYEFPRELGKASAAAKQFLVELCRPGQIGVSPFLRGFYFTGVRPIVVSDTAQAVAAPRPVSGGAVDATAVFDARAIQAAARQESAQPGTRRVPDWTFLPGIFKRVILKDHVAMGLTSGGTRVNLLRRLVFAILTGAFLFLAGALVVSWLRNRGLLEDARVAATAVQGIDQSGAGMATLEDLGRLDTLRTLGVRLRDWNVDGPPTSYRWGLYQGDALLGELRSLYFQRFGRLLWEGTRRNLAGFLLALPDTPTAASQYQSAFEGLKAYIITSDHPEYSTAEFLTPVLLGHWQTAREVEPERADAAGRQFDFFATELPFGNPYDAPAEAALVDDTRAFLARFGNTDRLYTALVSQASSSAAAIRFADASPGSEAVLRDELVVPGAFTRDGWTFVQQNVANVDRFFATDTWVLGEQTVSPADRQRMADSLRVRYVDEYVRTWAEFLSRARVVAYGGNAAVAARNLARLSSNQSPLLQLFSIASTNTAVDSPVIRAFQPVQLVVPPSRTDRLVGPGNQQYMTGLAQLASQMEAVAQANGPERTSAIGQAEGTARQVEATVTAMSLEFATQGAAAGIGASVRSLLMQPLDHLDPLIAAIPAGAINEQGASFCSTVQPVLSKYPFNSSSSTYATIEDLNRVFRPQGSALAALTSRLQDVVERLGSEYRARPGVEFTPTNEFLTMLNSVQRISDALYAENPQEPGFSYLLQPQRTEAFPEVTFAINGNNHTVTATEFGMRPFRWRLTEEREGRITARRADGGSITLVDVTGPWASFRMLAQARWQPSANGSYRLTWNVNTGTVSADVFPAGGPVPNPSLFQGLSCVPRVVR